MTFKSQYITADDIKNYAGIDLNYELHDDDNPSNKVNAFLFRLETRMRSYLDANYHQDIDRLYPTLSEHQKEHYKLALIEQAIYIVRNSDISVDSGYDPSVGIVADRGKLKELSLAPNAKEHLMVCGVLTRKIRRGSNMAGGIYGWWFY